MRRRGTGGRQARDVDEPRAALTRGLSHRAGAIDVHLDVLLVSRRRHDAREVHHRVRAPERLHQRLAATAADGQHRAVDQRHPDVDHRISGDDSLGHVVDDALLHRHPVVLRDGAAKDLVLPHEAFAALGRRHLDDTDPVLPVAA